MSKLSNKPIGLTLGDPGGIAPEVTAKALRAISFSSNIILIAHPRHFQGFRLPKNVLFSPPNDKLSLRITRGKPAKLNAQWALASLESACRLIKDKKIRALVTSPLSKESLIKIQPSFIGHTEYLAKSFKAKHVDMMFAAPKLRTVIVTRHDPIQQLPKLITQKSVFDCILLTHQTLQKNFKITSPKIAVCGLNPHAGEGGHIGTEDVKAIAPAIKYAQQQKICATGPFSADTLFIPTNRAHYDCIVTMYHDQGLIPMKTLYFNEVVNLTMGLPFIRTSPAHGTAYDLVGKNKAKPDSMISALNLAQKLSL